MRDSNSTLARSKADSVSEKSARSKEVIIEAEVENQVPVDVPVNTPKSEIFKLMNHTFKFLASKSLFLHQNQRKKS